MRTVRSLPYQGLRETPRTETPRQRPHDRDPLDRDHHHHPHPDRDLAPNFTMIVIAFWLLSQNFGKMELRMVFCQSVSAV